VAAGPHTFRGSSPTARRAILQPTMPTFTISVATLELLGIRRPHLVPTFTLEGRELLEGLLTSHGFDMARAIRVVELANGAGFVFTQ